MFTFTFGAQKRFYQKTGDGSLKHVRQVVAPLSLPLGTPEHPNYVAMDEVAIRDDSQIDIPGFLANQSKAHPAAARTMPLSIFDPADEASPDTDDLSASPVALVGEMRDMIDMTGEDADIHAIMTNILSHYSHNQTVLLTHLHDLAATGILIVLLTLAGYVAATIGAVVLKTCMPDMTLLANLAISLVLAMGAGALMLILHVIDKDRRGILIKDFISIGENNSAIMDKAVPQRQKDLISQQQQLYADLSLGVEKARMTGADNAVCAGLEARINLLFHNQRRLSRNRTHLALTLRTLGMIHEAEGAERLYAALGRPWRLGNAALGLVPRISQQMGWLLLIALLGLAIIIVPAVLGDRLDTLLSRHLNILPEAPSLLVAIQTAVHLAVTLIATCLILGAHATVRAPIDADTVRKINREASLKTCKGPADAGLRAGLAEHLILAVFRLLREEDKRR